MAIGRTFKEAIQKAVRSLEIGRHGLGSDGKDDIDNNELVQRLSRPNPDRIFYVREALARGMDIAEIHRLTHIDEWFLDQLAQHRRTLVAIREARARLGLEAQPAAVEPGQRRQGCTGRDALAEVGPDETREMSQFAQPGGVRQQVSHRGRAMARARRSSP